MPTRRRARTLAFLLIAALSLAVLPTLTATAQVQPLTGAAQIAQARRQLDALNTKVDIAVEEYDVGAIALAKAQQQAQVAQARVDRSRQQLAALQADFGSVAAAAYRSGGAGDFLTLVTTSSPQTFLDKASALDHISRNKREQIQLLRAASRELRAESAARAQAARAQQDIAARLAKMKASIEADVAAQKTLLKKLEVDEARRIAAARAAERRRQAALAAARAEQARLAKIEADRQAKLAAKQQALLEQQGRERQAARVGQLRVRRALEQAQAQRDADAADAAKATADAAINSPDPPPTPDPAPSAPPPTDGGGGSRGALVVRAAYAELGKPYVWAADGPDTFDCSGLTMFVWAKAGVSLPHSSRAQFGEGTRVSQGELRPGDLVFFGSPIHHVGIFVGGGSYIAAPQTGDVVSVRSMGRSDYVGAVRL